MQTDESGIIAELQREAWLPFPRIPTFDAKDVEGAEDVEAVHEGNTDLDFAGLAVWVSCAD